MKKIAVCLSGHPRTFADVASSIFDTFADFDVDYYFSTWDGQAENAQVLEIFAQHHANLLSYEFVKQPDLLKIERQICEAYTESFPDFFIMHQWYGVSRSIGLAMQLSELLDIQYDFIVRMRFDLLSNFKFKDIISAYQRGSIVIVPSLTKGSDQFFFAQPQEMRKFIHFPQWLSSFAEKYEAKYGFYASPLLRAFIHDSDLDIIFVREADLSVARVEKDARALREQRTRDYIQERMLDLADKLWRGNRARFKMSDKDGIPPWNPKFYQHRKNKSILISALMPKKESV